MNKTLSYIIGLIILAALFIVILFFTPDIYIFPGLVYLNFVKRALFVLILCAVLCLFRIVKGPTPADRIVSLDMFGILVIGFCAVLSISTGRQWYIDIGIAWALQSFISTLALAKYLEGKDFDD
ncbi:MAG: cation:proton antiporter [Candidatus Omnitrophica bacterium]|nr:cation:proton antiporter [Candidatus Omnitrophota bacterium]